MQPYLFSYSSLLTLDDVDPVFSHGSENLMTEEGRLEHGYVVEVESLGYNG